MVKTIAIDSDLMVYMIGFSAQTTVDFGEGPQSFGKEKEAELKLQWEVNKIRKHFGKRARIVYCLSDPKKNFRKDVLDTYKQNRSVKPGSGRPVLYDFIRDWFMQNTECRWEPMLEADDLLGIMATGPERAIMVSIDKDLLTIPGILCDPKTLKPTETSEKTATWNHYYQTIVGDSVDNYKGVPGLGKVKATKLLMNDPSWDAVQAAFVAHYSTKKGEPKIQAIARAIQQARVAYILMHDDYNFKTKEIKLWNPPSI